MLLANAGSDDTALALAAQILDEPRTRAATPAMTRAKEQV
jgi:allophanate hydrolase